MRFLDSHYHTKYSIEAFDLVKRNQSIKIKGFHYRNWMIIKNHWQMFMVCMIFQIIIEKTNKTNFPSFYFTSHLAKVVSEVSIYSFFNQFCQRMMRVKMCVFISYQLAMTVDSYAINSFHFILFIFHTSSVSI